MSSPDSHDDHGDFHVVPTRVLFATGTALLILTVVTVAAAQIDFVKWDLRELNIWVALAIAVIKASLVCLFFMHLKYDRHFNSFLFVGSIALVALFIGFAMTDTFEYKPDIVEYESRELGGLEPALIEQTLAENES